MNSNYRNALTEKYGTPCFGSLINLDECNRLNYEERPLEYIDELQPGTVLQFSTPYSSEQCVVLQIGVYNPRRNKFEISIMWLNGSCVIDRLPEDFTGITFVANSLRSK